MENNLLSKRGSGRRQRAVYGKILWGHGLAGENLLGEVIAKAPEDNYASLEGRRR